MTIGSFIDTNLRNPGHFFACCGLMHCADRMLAGVKAHFDGDRFVMTAPGCDDPAGTVIGRLRNGADPVEAEDADSSASPVLLTNIPGDYAHSTGSRATAPGGGPQGSFAHDPPARLDFWEHFDDRPKIKLFAGQQSSAAVLRRCYDSFCECDPGGSGNGQYDWKACSRMGLPTGIDPDTRWTSLDVGFSLNDQGKKAMRTYPLVEYFAHVGVQGYGWRRKGAEYWYRTWGRPLPYGPAMAAAAGSLPVGGARQFAFALARSGSNKTFNMSREAPH